ncbi:slipin family protein [bacterium]|nr:slipin family protein [bacterium]NBX97738.1 slipin family protein [bacterium]NDC93846.1 slipin family protein [bacterium]NDD84197.1 slipin family protein [bacterium]NDG28792.1 slipin family protein [bacterium]
MEAFGGFGIFLLIIGIIAVVMGLRLVNQYEKGVVFRLGRVSSTPKEPGLRVIIPFVDVMRKVDMRIITLPVDSQQIITKDNVSIDVAAVAYYQVNDATKSLVEISNVVAATYQIAQTTIRNIVGQSNLDEVLSQTTSINDKIKLILDTATEKWGVYISTVELKDIKLPDSMQRAMAKQAEAEREKRAKIIAAEGEAMSAAKLGEAADIISAHPIALQLRNLQVLSEIAVEKNSTIIFPSQFMDTVDSVKHFMAKESTK